MGIVAVFRAARVDKIGRVGKRRNTMWRLIDKRTNPAPKHQVKNFYELAIAHRRVSSLVIASGRG